MTERLINKGFEAVGLVQQCWTKLFNLGCPSYLSESFNNDSPEILYPADDVLSSPDPFADPHWKRLVNVILSRKNIHNTIFLPDLPISENLIRLPNSLSVALVTYEFSHARPV